jgi:SAM-dependent methyltransferase
MFQNTIDAKPAAGKVPQIRQMKIDLGSGRVRRKGYLSIDRIWNKEVDVVCDMEERLPFADNSIDGVFSRHLFEHIRNLIPLFEEVYRVCKPGARVIINVPYYTSIKAYKDPTHVNFFTEKTFEYFVGNSWENFVFPFIGSFRIVMIFAQTAEQRPRRRLRIHPRRPPLFRLPILLRRIPERRHGR